MPRDCDASFEPVIVKKDERNISNVEEAIISLYARSQSTRDITEHIMDIDKIWFRSFKSK